MATKHIIRLENALGVRLLNRTTRRLSLTEVGRAYLERCVQILAEVEEAEPGVTELRARLRGVLKVTEPANFGAFPPRSRRGGLYAALSRREDRDHA